MSGFTDRCLDTCRICFRKVGSGRLPVFVTGMAAVGIIAWLYIQQPLFIKTLDLKVYDAMLRETHTTEITDVPVIVDLDERSLAMFGQWPWPRYRVALLLAKLREAGASAVGLDILFAEPDRTSPKILKQQIKRDLHVDMGFTGIPDALMDNDQVFASVLAQGPFVLGYFFDFALTSGKTDDCLLKPLNASVMRAPGADTSVPPGLDAPAVVQPLKVLCSSSRAQGFFNTEPDEDGILRRTPLFVHYKGNLYPNLSLSTLLQALGTNQALVKMSVDGVESIRIGNTVIPLDKGGQMLINFRGGEGTFRYISASKVLGGKLKKDELAGKMVFIGTSAAGLKDIRAMPFDQNYPGVETHATIVDNILKGDFIFRPNWAMGAEFMLIVVSGLLATLLLTFASAAMGVLPVAATGAGLWWGALYMMGDKGMYVSPLYPLIALGLTFAVLTVLKYWREEGQKKFLHATFSSYLAPELIDQMFENQTMPSLGGEAKIITAYFTDIQSFSTFSEKLTAVQLVELLNEYLTAMTDILIDNMGTLDKYEGDAIVAFIGAPLDVPDHGLRACRIAVLMQDKLLELRGKWASETVNPDEPPRNCKNLPPEEWAPDSKWPRIVHNMRVRIGINSGEIVVGNMGSTMRMNYTMMGDSVNLAARLEAGAKQYGIFNMISQYTMALEYETEDGQTTTVGESVEARFVDNIQVVGKNEPVKVYELVAMKGGLTEDEQELFNRFEKAMALYHDQKWDEAIKAFEHSQEIERFKDAKINPSKVFIQRCGMFKENPPVPPGETWDGVFRLTSK